MCFPRSRKSPLSTPRIFVGFALLVLLTALLCLTPAQAQDLSITTPATLPDGAPGALFSVTLSATGGTSPYSWRFPLGENRPFFLDITSVGLLSGIPSATDSDTTFTFHLQVTDARDRTAGREFTLTVK